MREDKDLDLLLDTALATYADPGPDSGLETRILARISTCTASTPSRRWSLWTAVLPLAACLAVAAFLVFGVPRGTNHQQLAGREGFQLQLPERAPLSAPAGQVVRGAATHLSDCLPTLAAKNAVRMGHGASVLAGRPEQAGRGQIPAPAPKLETFPSQQPLSPELEALLDYTRRATPQARQQLFDTQARLVEPVTIAPIVIPPLDPPAEGDN